MALAIRPFPAYRQLVAADVSTGWRDVFGRVFFTVILNGAVIAVCATGRAPFELVASVSIYWSFAAALQLLAGMLLVRSARTLAVPMARALDLFLLGHAPWSLWLLALSAFFAIDYGASPVPFSGARPLLATAVIPIVWTAVIVSAFGRSVLRLSPRAAIARAVLHQTLLWGATILFFTWLTDSWARAAAVLR